MCSSGIVKITQLQLFPHQYMDCYFKNTTADICVFLEPYTMRLAHNNQTDTKRKWTKEPRTGLFPLGTWFRFTGSRAYLLFRPGAIWSPSFFILTAHHCECILLKACTHKTQSNIFGNFWGDIWQCFKSPFFVIFLWQLNSSKQNKRYVDGIYKACVILTTIMYFYVEQKSEPIVLCYTDRM